MMFIIFQVLAGILSASFIEWTVHKHILHELGKKKVSIFSFHWGKHHAAARRNGFIDRSISGREAFGVFSLCVLALPILFLLPFTYYVMLLHAATYYVLHTVAHRYPKFARKWIPWHYDHHMGKNQNMNWCVVHPLADWIMKTRIKYDYE